MYGLALDGAFLALHCNPMPDSAEFCFKQLCPYMTQVVRAQLVPDDLTMPVLSWQLARQLVQAREDHPELHAFRLIPLSPDDGWPVPRRIESFEGVNPGRLLLLTANLRRGLGDMLLLMPIFEALSRRLEALGWSPQFGLTMATRFHDLMMDKPFCEAVLPECPSLASVMAFDYVLEFGLNLERMQRLVGVRDWRDMPLRVQLEPRPERIAYWQKIIASQQKNVFVNWLSFDKKRSLPNHAFTAIFERKKDYTFYTSQAEDAVPEGLVNLRPFERDLADLVAMLSLMDVVITTNTGVAHVAAALGRPTIVLFTGRLYGWEGYWPDLHPWLYPTMYPVGLKEKLQLDEADMLRQVFDLLERLESESMRLEGASVD